MDYSELTARWRQEAANYERDGALVPGAPLINRLADELERFELQTVSTAEAAKISGHTQAHLRQLANDGILSCQRHGSRLRFRIRDLPRKPGHCPKSNIVLT